MRRIAFAKLLRSHPKAWQCTVEIVELDNAPAVDPQARFVVTLRQGEVNGGVVLQPRESSLTARPCDAAEAERRVVDFVQRRLTAGEQLLHSEGLSSLQAPAEPVLNAPAPSAPTPAASAASAAMPARMAALAARLAPDRWKLRAPTHQSRTIWRIAECSDPQAETEADLARQRALVALVPRLVELLETGDDLLDHCLAVAIARLRDAGAAVAMQALAQRGRSPATRRMAQQAWLLLQSAEAQRAHADTLSPAWQADFVDTAPAEARWADLQARLESVKAACSDVFVDWYDVALSRPDARASLLGVLRVVPLQPGTFRAVRYVYKAAEIRRDAEVLAVLHARFERTPPYFESQGVGNSRGFTDPATGRWVKKPESQELSQPDSRLAYSRRTRHYLRLRGWRTLRRLAALGHSHSPELAVQLLLGLVDDELPAPHTESRWSYVDGRMRRTDQYRHGSAGWLIVPPLLLAKHPGVHASPHSGRWWTEQPLDTSLPFAQRTDGLVEMWNAHPQALLRLALHSRSALVQAVVARALADHAGFVSAQPPAVLKALLQSAYPPAARVGFNAVRSQLQASPTRAEQALWLVLLVDSADAAARDFAFAHIAADPAGFAQQPALVVALLLSAHERSRGQGHGLALIGPATALVNELQSALLAVDAGAPGLDASVALIESLLRGPWADAAAKAPIEPLLCLLDHAGAPVLHLAVVWLLLHPLGLALVPPSTMVRLLGDHDPDRRASGVRLLAALSDELLLTQTVLIVDLAVHPHAGIREAIEPALHRLATRDAAFAAALAARLHASLFSAEAGEGQHEHALQWLSTSLRDHAPARDPGGTWRALQAQSVGAQRYGARALATLSPADFSLRQQATLARHADVSVRQWAMHAIDRTLPPVPTPEQAAQLLPMVDTLFDDARHHAMVLFEERLPDESLTPELLIAWVDHPQPWVQALGRGRLVRRMSAGEASLCLTRLAQHPSTSVQLFVTQWLLELPRDDDAHLADRLRGLLPYFFTVLSQVNRARVAKTRITEFLRAASATPLAAAVVAEVFARQVVTSSLTDKPQYIAGLRDIAARHPQIELPFFAWSPPPMRGSGGRRAGETAA